MCDLFAQMHAHSNTELIHSLMLEEILYPFDISPSPATERFTTAEGFYSRGEHLFIFIFCTLFLINNIQRKWSLSLLRHNVSLAIKVKVGELSKQMNTRYSTWAIKHKWCEFYIFMDNTNIVPASLLPCSLCSCLHLYCMDLNCSHSELYMPGFVYVCVFYTFCP